MTLVQSQRTSVSDIVIIIPGFFYDWSSGEKIPLDQISIEQLEDRKIQFFDESLFFNVDLMIRREEYDENSYHDVVIIYPYYSLAQKIQLAEERFDLSSMPQGQAP